jgi:integrase
LIEKYVQEKLREGSWKPRTEAGNRAKLNLLLDIIGDIPAGSVTAANARAYKDALQQLPSNFKKASLYAGMSIQDIIATTPTNTLSIKTINEYLMAASSVIDWCKRQSYIDNENYFKGMKLKSTGLARDEVEIFNDSDLKQIFNYPTKLLHPYRYWIPLIGLYSGMRLEEIAQLYLKDIKQINTTWVMSIDDDEPDKSIKNKHSKRTVPIHSELLRLGLLEFAEQQRAAGEHRLFPELKKIGGRYGKTVSSWFSLYKTKLGLGKTKKFHSLRHTFTNALKQSGVVEGMTDELTGHATDGISYSRYAERCSLASLTDTVNAISFEIYIKAYNQHD